MSNKNNQLFEIIISKLDSLESNEKQTLELSIVSEIKQLIQGLINRFDKSLASVGKPNENEVNPRSFEIPKAVTEYYDKRQKSIEQNVSRIPNFYFNQLEIALR